MNIFYLSTDTRICAQYHTNKHLVKMITESAQILCTVKRVLDTDCEFTNILYKVTHKNHPSTLWAMSSKKNYLWLYSLFRQLCVEYTFRYKKIHACETKLLQILKSPPKNIPETKFTQPTLAMPDQYKDANAVRAYRNYYIGAKSHLFMWKKRPAPYWIPKHLILESSKC